MVGKVHEVLQQAGFPVIPLDQVECVWYRTHIHHQAFVDDYFFNNTSLPAGFTLDQRKYLVEDLENLAQNQTRTTENSRLLQQVLLAYADEMKTWPLDQAAAPVKKKPKQSTP